MSTTTYVQRIAGFAGPLAAAATGVALFFQGTEPAISWTAAVTVLCATWWIFEPIPIAATSLVPLGLLPLVGVLRPSQVAEAYGNPLILLLLGGFVLSAGMERSGAHRRLALGIVSIFGNRTGRPLVFGFMAAGAVLSMWISNTATALMLLPIAQAALEGVKNDKRLKVAVVLGIAYACSVGGTATPIGTPPNLIFIRVYGDAFGSAPTFTDWMSWAFPIVGLMVPAMGLWLTRGITRGEPLRLPHPGKWRPEEVRTLVVFGVTALLWVTRREPFGGWSGWLDLPQANDASIALLAVVAMFLIPNGKGERLLDWPTAVKIPWGILILFGAGVTIATAFSESGLSQALGTGLAQIGTLPTLAILLIICLSVTFLTEVTSNTATTALLMPILASAALAADMDGRLLMVPAAISASFAFMLPVATGPNAVVFGSGEVTVRQMARQGFVLNLVGVLVIGAICYVQFG